MSKVSEVKSYLVRIELLYTHRPIWREVWVPSDLTLDLLHEVIQCVMGWDDDHMHGFEFQKQRFQSLEFIDGFDDDAGKSEELVELGELLKRARQKLTYTYDFGDSWCHSVTLKKQAPLSVEQLLTCVGGEGACPLEDCGGVYGHERVCAFVKDAVDDGFMPYEEWGVGEYDPDLFDIDAVNQQLSELKADEYDDMAEDANLDDFTDQLWDFGDEDRPSFLPRFDVDDDEEDDEEAACPEPYLNLSEAERRQFREAMEQAKMVRELQPWKELWDQDVFCIKDPDTGLLDFVSILGRGGEVFALHVHHGVEGYNLWQRTMLGTMPMDDPDLYLQSLRVTEVEFVNKGQMEPEDLSLYKQIPFITPSRGRQLWMKFRRYHPRAGAPWFPNTEDMPRLIRAMRLCTKYIELLRAASKAGRFKYEHQDGGEGQLATSLPCFTLTERATKRALSGEDLSAWDFSHVSMNWQEADELAVAFEPLEFELQQFANLAQVDEAWELGAVYLRQPVGTPEGPVLPILAVAASLDVSIDTPPVPYLGSTLAMTPGEAVWRGLAQSALARGCRPAEVHVTTSLAQATLKPLEALSATRIVRQPNFQQLHELLNMMSQF